MTHAEAIEVLKTFVANEYSGSIADNFALDELLWKVRISHPHNSPSHTRQAETAVPVEIEIDLEELGL